MDGYRSPTRSDKPNRQEQRGEARLIQRAQQGDRQALGELYERHVDPIYRYIRTRVRDDAVAEDLTAEVFIKALEGLSEYEARGYPFQAWLYRIARARTVDYWRRQERRREVALEETIPTEGSHPEELVEMQDQWGRAMDLVAQLTDDQQDVLILRFIGELTLSEVAAALGKSTGSVKSLQHRALSSLARLLDEQTAVGSQDA